MKFPRLKIGSAAVYHVGVACVPTVLESLVGRVSRSVCDARIAVMARDLLATVDAQLEVQGAENVPRTGPLLVMSNHQSLYDIPALFASVPRSMRMVAKKELFRVPIWGGAMKASGFVCVDRGDHAAAIKSLDEARERMKDGVAIWIAPEGTRSRDGTLGKFKKGGFVLAQQANAPILPVTVWGTKDILPARTWEVHRGCPVKVTIHPPVQPGTPETREAVMEQVRAAIASALPNEGRA